MYNVVSLWAILFIVLCTPFAKADIVPDGSTLTKVTVNNNAPILVEIAIKDANSISHNRYDEFSVGIEGVQIDNRTQFARTIINEVTSTKRSILQGNIEILGTAANLIIANPNGITANGVSFTNTGGVVLGAGNISYKAYGGASNAILNATGDIVVEGGGVFGKIVSLQLLAHKIKIDGAVVNNKDYRLSPDTPDIKIVAGKNSFEFDSTSLPVDAGSKWIKETTKDVSADSSILIDVTPRGGLTAGRVSIEVSHEGAGVSYAGNGMANVGNFDIMSHGNLKMSKGKITAKQHANIIAKKITIETAKESASQTQIEALNGGVYMESTDGDIDIAGGLVYGVKKDDSNVDIKGGVHLKSSNDVNLTSLSAKNLAIIFASGDDAYVEATNDINNHTGRIISNKKTTLKAGRNILNLTDIKKVENAGVKQSFSRNKERLWYSFWLARRKETGFNINYGQPIVDGQSGYIVGDEISLTAKDIKNIGGEMNANDGDIVIDSETFVTEAVVAGEATYTRSCALIVCSSIGKSDVRLIGGILNASKDISVTATKSFLNYGGQITPYGDFTLTSPDVKLIAKRIVTIVERPGGLRHLFGQHAWVYDEYSGGLITVPLGSANITTSKPIEITAGKITWADKFNSNYDIKEIYTAPLTSPVGDYKAGVLWRFLP